MDNPKGLGTGTWYDLPKKLEKLDAIDRLADEKLHQHVKDYLVKRIRSSEDSMGRFYSRWRVNEMKFQAYIDLPDWEKELKRLSNKGDPAKCVSITVPYAFSVLNTIVTYLVHAFLGNSPIFKVGADKSEFSASAQNMEVYLQYNANHVRLTKHIFQFLNDSTMYGVGILRNQWKTEKKMRTLWTEKKGLLAGLSLGTSTMVRERREKITFEGTEVSAVDPFMFFPDPTVPMSEVNTRGEYVFWKEYLGKHTLLGMQKEGTFKYVDKAPSQPSSNFGTMGANTSARGLISSGDSSAGDYTSWNKDKELYETMQGTCVIIPKELGLGEEDYPVKYLFTILNKSQIVQAEPLDYDHDKHPVSITEPYSMGYGFGQPGIIDYMAPLQDLMSWLVNSHMDNVKTMLNNMWLVDPSRVEMQDLKQPGAGKLIRLKRAAYGTDVNSAVRQLQVGDVTSGHLRDFELVMKLADMLSAVNDNLKGIQDGGGRKTATEVRTSNEAGASRLASLAKKISSQAMVDLAEQMSLNAQQFLSDEFLLEVIGESAGKDNIRVTPQTLVGDFNFPVHDGTMPVDKLALVDVWKQIFQGISADPQMRSQFNVVGVFSYLSKLAGAKNIDQFILKQTPDDKLEASAAAGNSVPLSEAANIPGAPAMGLEANPADRMAL